MIHNAPRPLCRVPRRMPNIRHFSPVAHGACWERNWTPLILTADSCQSGLSNELGANGKINYLKNIIGLWLIQESRREYKRRGQAYSFAELEQQALAAEPLRSFIDPDAPEFVAPGDLPGRIQEFCRKTGQPVPETVGAVMRCIYESLALKYRYAIEQLSAVTGRAFTTLHVLGGPARFGRRHKRPSALPDDGRLLRPYSKGRPGGSYGARQHYDSVESLGGCWTPSHKDAG